MKEVIKTASLLIAFLVMLGCVYLEVDIRLLLKRTFVTFVACNVFGFMALYLANIMIGKQSAEKKTVSNRPEIEASA